MIFLAGTCMFTRLPFYTFFACGLSFLISCKDTEKESVGKINNISYIKEQPITPESLSGCYQSTIKKDTAFLRLTFTNDSLFTGQLMYNHFEKDKNTGTLKGIWRDSILLADYSFNSEGVTSTREVIFKIKDHYLVEAYGEMKQIKNKSVFNDPGNLFYNIEHPFYEIECEK